jgi:hypothetical protein
MLRKFLSGILACLLATCTLPAAEILPGRWQLVDALPAGTPITIQTRAGERLPCLYFSSDRESLLVVQDRGGQRRILKSTIESVVAEKYDDRLRNGSILGMAAGVGVAVCLATIPGDMTRRNRVNMTTFGSVLFGLCGMGLGALIDFHHKGRQLIYQAIKK